MPTAAVQPTGDSRAHRLLSTAAGIAAAYLGSIRVVAEPAQMLLYNERNMAEAVIARVAGGTLQVLMVVGACYVMSRTPASRRV